jgi:hypothetical protein
MSGLGRRKYALTAAPVEVDLRRHTRVTPSSLHQMVPTLQCAGLIRRQPRVVLSIEVPAGPERLPGYVYLNSSNLLCR